MKFLNRLLYQIHRWVGLVLAVFMFVWFFTGLVIMYAPSITQTHAEQLAHAEALTPEVGWLSLGEAWERSTEQRNTAQPSKAKTAEAPAAQGDEKKPAPPGIVDARLVRSANQPLWLVEDSRGQRFALSAVDGSVRKTTPELAVKIAENWAYNEGRIDQASFVETVDNPVILRNQDALKPFHRIAIGDDGGQLLISSRTGEVLHASTRIDRAFYWAGNWLHLFKPLESLGLGAYRHDVQLWSGLLATLAALTGLIIGWLRWRPGLLGKPTYSEGRTQPYREFWFKWHFWSGLLGGTVALFWALSGYLDTNPGKIFSQANPSKQEIARYIGDGLPQTMSQWQPTLPINLAAAVDGGAIVELSWKRLGNEAVLLANTRQGRRLLQNQQPGQTGFTEAALLAAVQRIAGKTPIASQVAMTDYDSYYYARHDQGLQEKPLPVLLVQLSDDVGTRLYIDPQDGKLLAKLDRSARVFRWLYSALHHWDFGWLNLRPLWDVWMLTWVSFGLVLGASSLVIGWRLLKKTLKPKRQGGSQPRTGRRYVHTLKTQTSLAGNSKTTGIAATATFVKRNISER
ncbi:MAG: PepSY domain-containing protein [Methylococcales bacterium]